jgi:hypothetical protein
MKGDVMRRFALLAAAVAALAFIANAPASAAEANDRASCAGLAAASRAGSPGAQAEVVHSVIAETHPPGDNFHDFAWFHDGSAEACLA